MHITRLTLVAACMACCGLALASERVGQRIQLFYADPIKNLIWDQFQNHAAPNDFTFRFNQMRAGGLPNDVGGAFGRGKRAWYADIISKKDTLLDPKTTVLRASGRANITKLSGILLFGWFNSTTYAETDEVPHPFIGWRQADTDSGDLCPAFAVEPTEMSVGDPAGTTIEERSFTWSLKWDPNANENHGAITMSLNGGTSTTLNLPGNVKDTLGPFDRFGIVTLNMKSQPEAVGEAFLDNWEYTVISGFPQGPIAHPTRSQNFDTDPHWNGINNKPPFPNPVEVTQDYKYRPTGGRDGGGCIGGSFSRGVGRPGYYAKRLSPARDFSEPLTASGWFKVDSVEGSHTDLLLGWTNSKTRGWRNMNFLGLHLFSFDWNDPKYWIHIEYGSNDDQHAGYENMFTLKPSPTTWHHFAITYDPGEPNDSGAITVSIDHAGTVTVPLAAGIKNQGAELDLFGIEHAKVDGAQGRYMVAYVDDLVLDGELHDFNSDPGWAGLNNDNHRYLDDVLRVRDKNNLDHFRNDFGYQPDGNHMGGHLFRIDPRSLHLYGGAYGDDVTSGGRMLDSSMPMFARGKIRLDWDSCPSDNGCAIGWYNTEEITRNHDKAKYVPNRFLGVYIQGMSDKGLFFEPSFSTANDTGNFTNIFGPRLVPGDEWVEFYIEYNPNGYDPINNVDCAEIKVQLGAAGALQIWYIHDDLKGEAERGFAFDRFGLLTGHLDGKPVKVSLDELTYTIY